MFTKWIKLFVWTLLIKLSTVHGNLNEMMPIVTIEMNNDGFHRELNYIIHFDYPMAGKDCEYYLEQHLPAAVYINVDQFNDLVRLKKLKAVYPRHIDVEIPTEKAFAFSVLLFGTPKISDHIIVPIHYRYHSPATDKNFVRVQIDIPAMFMKCPDSEGVTLPEDSKNTSYCIEDTTFLPQSLATNSQSENCDWKYLEYNLRAKPLIVNIPVGNSNLYERVLYSTILVSWMGCISVLYTVHTKIVTLKHKLK